MNMDNTDKKIDQAERVMEIVNKNGLAICISVVFIGYMIYNNITLNNRLERHVDILEKNTITLESFDKTLDAIGGSMKTINDRVDNIDERVGEIENTLKKDK